MKGILGVPICGGELCRCHDECNVGLGLVLLLHCVQPGEPPESNGAASDWGATEHMLLMALESLYKDGEELDVRLGLLRVLLQILQRHGAHSPHTPAEPFAVLPNLTYMPLGHLPPSVRGHQCTGVL